MTEVICRYLEEAGHGTIQVDKGYYWAIPPDEKYDPSVEPPGHTLGDLDVDIENLRSILLDGKDPIAYHLVWLGEVFAAVGTTVGG